MRDLTFIKILSFNKFFELSSGLSGTSKRLLVVNRVLCIPHQMINIIRLYTISNGFICFLPYIWFLIAVFISINFIGMFWNDPYDFINDQINDNFDLLEKKIHDDNVTKEDVLSCILKLDTNCTKFRVQAVLFYFLFVWGLLISCSYNYGRFYSYGDSFGMSVNFRSSLLDYYRYNLSYYSSIIY